MLFRILSWLAEKLRQKPTSRSRAERRSFGDPPADPCQLYKDALEQTLLDLDEVMQRLDAQLQDLWNCQHNGSPMAAEYGDLQTAAAALQTAFDGLGQGGPGEL